ncbi:hypothetical protein, partial [Clostridioides difficile]|uniref:hypothetical protein n=1 Tax=Clostridioides difficile TaxID=1496 RepID=UPI001A9A5729
MGTGSGGGAVAGVHGGGQLAGEVFGGRGIVLGCRGARLDLPAQRPPGRAFVDHAVHLAAGAGAEVRGDGARLHFQHLDAERCQLQAQGIAQRMH